MSDAARRFGEMVSEALGNGPSKAAFASQRVHLLLELERGRRRRFFRIALSAATAACAAMLVVFGIGSRQSARTELTASSNGRTLPAVSRLEVPAGQARAVEFSDGSRVVLEAQTRAELRMVDAKQAKLLLDSGQLKASITKETGVTWSIDAGPYAVRVVGTRFSVDWDEQRRRLRVDVREGRVRVSGGALPAAGVLLAAGSHLEQLPPPEAFRDVGSAAVADDAVDRAPPKTTEAGEGALPALSKAPAARPEWLRLASAAKYREAMSAAEAAGFDRLAATLPANELLVLSNAARYSGASLRARQALRKLRERFPRTPSAHLAALYLARVAEDFDHDPAEAARWLRVFLRESPSGDLAAGARADLMSILLRRGDRDAARAVAQDYLRHHPKGAHAKQALRLTQPTPPP